MIIANKTQTFSRTARMMNESNANQNENPQNVYSFDVCVRGVFGSRHPIFRRHSWRFQVYCVSFVIVRPHTLNVFARVSQANPINDSEFTRAEGGEERRGQMTNGFSFAHKFLKSLFLFIGGLLSFWYSRCLPSPCKASVCDFYSARFRDQYFL